MTTKKKRDYSYRPQGLQKPITARQLALLNLLEALDNDIGDDSVLFMAISTLYRITKDTFTIQSEEEYQEVLSAYKNLILTRGEQ